MVASAEPHPLSVIHAVDGRQVVLKVHRCRWDGTLPGNSLAAVQACYQARVARAEIDFALLRDADFLVIHDVNLADSTTGSGLVGDATSAEAARLWLRWQGRTSAHRPPLLSEVVAAIAAEPYLTLLELDMKDQAPWPWPRVEELVKLLQPVKDRITFGGEADWNLRRLRRVDPSLRLGFTPTSYLDFLTEGARSPRLPGRRGAYSYLDDHPLADARRGTTPEYLRDRLGGILPLVPGARDLHLRLGLLERMLDDGFSEATEMAHAAGMSVDVWTLDAGTSNWRERLERAVTAGVDVVTTNTPREMARAWSELASVANEPGLARPA